MGGSTGPAHATRLASRETHATQRQERGHQSGTADGQLGPTTNLLLLQRVAGNQAVVGLIQRVMLLHKDEEGSVGQSGLDFSSLTQLRKHVKEASSSDVELQQLKADIETTQEYAKGGEVDLLKQMLAFIDKKLNVAPVAPALPAKALPAFDIHGSTLDAVDDAFKGWLIDHPTSKGTLKKSLEQARVDIAGIRLDPKIFAAHREEIGNLFIDVQRNLGKGEGLPKKTTETKAPKKKAPKDFDFGACADAIIASIASIHLPGNRGLDVVNSPGASTKNATAIFDQLSAKYHGAPATWAGPSVTYYIVRGDVDKIDVTGHIIVANVDRSIRDGTNVFNYHLNW